jgi:regulator of sigma E protease
MGSNMISAFLNGDYTQWIIPFLFVLTIIVLFHELGHYLVARWCGVRVTVFSLGFGKELLGFTDRHGTRWKVSAIPLGGYVKFFGDENETSVPNPATLAAMTDEERRQSFPGQPVGNRAMIAAAGPIVNFILAIAIFAGVFMVVGKTTAISRIGGVEDNSPASAAGIKAGDLVVSIDGAPVSKFDEVARIVSANPGAQLTIVVDRNGVLTTLKATPAERDKGGKLGIRSSNADADTTTEPVSPVEAVQLGAERTWFVVSTTLTAIHDIVLGKQSAAQLGGPIMIAQLSGKVAQRGLDVLLGFTAMLSASVGLFNLFPIPILDGGHLLLCLFEAVRGKPLSERVLEMSFRVGLVLIGTLFVFVIFNDLHRLLTGTGL